MEGTRLELTIRVAAYMFLLGVVMLVSSAVPAVARRYRRVFVHGFLLSVLSLFVVLAGALVFR